MPAETPRDFFYNFASVVPSYTSLMFPGATATTATDVNNAGVVSGFYTNASGTFGFLDNAGTFTSYSDPNGTNTMFLGLNNNGQVVGSYVDTNGVTQGLLFNGTTFETISDPLASTSTTPNTFNVTGTTVNGINDNGQLVGFFADNSGNVDGFLAPVPSVPEPASLGLMMLGGAFLIGLSRRRKQNIG